MYSFKHLTSVAMACSCLTPLEPHHSLQLREEAPPALQGPAWQRAQHVLVSADTALRKEHSSHPSRAVKPRFGDNLAHYSRPREVPSSEKPRVAAASMAPWATAHQLQSHSTESQSELPENWESQTEFPQLNNHRRSTTAKSQSPLQLIGQKPLTW